MNNNPSPGNKAGGLTTILEKSLGASAKGGRSTLRAVYEYAEPGDAEGLRLHGHARLRPGRRDGPGRGRREPHLLHHRAAARLRAKPAPSIKLATNSDIYRRWRTTWTSIAATSSTACRSRRRGREIFAKILAVASASTRRARIWGYGDAEFVPWQIGAVM
jgi:altronate hydrolase